MGIKNTLGDLNNHLFMQLERLNDEDIKGEALKEEMERAKSISIIAKQIIDNASVVLDAQKVLADQFGEHKLPAMLEG